MSLERFFSRNEESTDIVETVSQHAESKIACDTGELKELITNWTSNQGWEFENFSDFLELVGIKTPVKLSELNKEKKSFKCISVDGKEIQISLVFGDLMDDSEIHLTVGEETKCYYSNQKLTEIESVPKVDPKSRNIKCDGKELSCNYSYYFCDRLLKLDDTHFLKLEINEPRYKIGDKILVLQNCDKVEQYLLTLDTSLLVISDVYKNVMKLLGLSHNDISKFDEILISYIENIKGEECVRSGILIKRGVMQKYDVLEEGGFKMVIEGVNY